MIIFTVPKPFIGKFAIIQENAINSWLSIKPKPKIVLLGNEVGISTFCKLKHIKQIPYIKKNKYGSPLLNDIFNKIQKMFKDQTYMYINTDIILQNLPTSIIKDLTNKFDRFLIVGKRYEMNVDKKLDTIEIKQLSTTNLKQKNDSWIDYLIFTPGIFSKIPPFALGKTFYDKWLIWFSKTIGCPVVDLTIKIKAIHQSHQYFKSTKYIWEGRETLNNLKIAGGFSHGRTISDADFKFTKKNKLIKIKKNWFISFKYKLMEPFDRMLFIYPLLMKMRYIRNIIGSNLPKE